MANTRDPQTSDLNPYVSPATLALFSDAYLGKPIRRFKRVNFALMFLGALTGLLGVPCCIVVAGMNFLPGPIAVLFIPFIAAVIWMITLAARFLSELRYRRLGQRLANQLRKEQLDPLDWNGRFVQFAPAGELRVYEAHTEWDAGYFFMFSDQCTFLGVRTRFSIPRLAIGNIAVGYGSVEVPLTYQVRVHWRNAFANCDEVFSIWPGAPKVLQHFQETSGFAQQMRAWVRAEIPSTETPSWACLPIPDLGDVPSKSVEDVSPRWLVIAALIGLFVCMLGATIWLTTQSAPVVGKLWWFTSWVWSVVLYLFLLTLPRLLLRDPATAIINEG